MRFATLGFALGVALSGTAMAETIPGTHVDFRSVVIAFGKEHWHTRFIRADNVTAVQKTDPEASTLMGIKRVCSAQVEAAIPDHVRTITVAVIAELSEKAVTANSSCLDDKMKAAGLDGIHTETKQH